jgi:hypothetical protein
MKRFKTLRLMSLVSRALMVLLVAGLSMNPLHAQWGDDDGGSTWGDDGATGGDATGDGFDSNNGGDSGFGGDSNGTNDDAGFGSDPFGGFGFGDNQQDDEEEQRPRVVRKPYVRFQPPYDSIKEMVIYSAIIDVVDKDGYEREVDTLYHKAQAWLKSEFGEKELKKMIGFNGENTNASEMEYKIRLRGTFPCIIRPNEFTKHQSGDIEFLMELRIREGRYRYKISDLVHIAPIMADEKEGERTYFEFLRKSEDNVRGGDQILIAADNKINDMMSELEKFCKTFPEEEEDDW